MAAISASAVKELRERTGAGMMDCKHALAETKGDMEKAIDYLREKGIAKAAKKASRSAKDGRVFCYIHTNAKIASMVELNCETDFVAKTDEFQELGQSLMQVAASAPLFVSSEEVPEDVVEREKKFIASRLLKKASLRILWTELLKEKCRSILKHHAFLIRPIFAMAIKINDLIIEHIAKL